MKKIIIATSIILSLFIITSCKEEAGTGNLKIVLEQEANLASTHTKKASSATSLKAVSTFDSNSITSSITNTYKTISPSETANRVSKYNISGNGAGGKSFSKDSTGKSITIEGIALGEWEINAYALSQGGSVLASGTKKITISGAETTEKITIYEKAGFGSAELTIEGLSNLSNPLIQIELDKIEPQVDAKGIEPNYTINLSPNLTQEDTPDFEIDSAHNITSNSHIFKASYSPQPGSSSYFLQLKELQSGYYTIHLTLSDGGTKVSSAVEALKIVGNTATTGKIDLSSSNSSYSYSYGLTDDANAEIQCSEGFTLKGSISKLDKELIADETYTASFSPFSNFSTKDNLKILWYADGSLSLSSNLRLSDSNNFSFKAQNGNHIISCIIINYSNGTCSGAKLKYSGKKESPKGVATLAKIFYPENNQEIHISSTSVIGLLPNGKILELNPQTSTLQILDIQENRLILEAHCTYSTTLENFGFLSKMKNLYSSAVSNYFVLTDGIKNVYILKYNPDKNNVSLAQRVQDDSPVYYNGIFPTSNTGYNSVSCVSICPAENTGAVNSNPRAGESKILFTDSLSSNIFIVQTANEGIISETLVNKGEDCSNTLAISLYRNKLFYCTNKAVLISDISIQDYSDTVCLTSRTSYETDLYGAYKIAFINSENFIIGYNSGIKRLQMPTYGYDISLLGEVDLFSSDFAVTPDGEYIYVCTRTGKFHSFATNYAGIFKNLDTFQTNANFKQVLANDKYTIALDSNGILYLFEISSGK